MDVRLLQIMMDLMEITLDCTKMSSHEKATLLTKKKRPEILQKIFDLGDKITQFRATVDGAAEVEEKEEKKRGRPKKEPVVATLPDIPVMPDVPAVLTMDVVPTIAAEAPIISASPTIDAAPTIAVIDKEDTPKPKRGRPPKTTPGAPAEPVALVQPSADPVAPVAPVQTPTAPAAPVQPSEPGTDMEPLHVRRKKIPKHIRTLVWNQYMSSKMIEGRCVCCETTDIKMTNFHCGHVIAESKGGTLEITNLRPICAECNTSMGSQSMNEFMKTFFGREIAT